MAGIPYSITIMSTTPGTKKEDITETKAYPVLQTSETLSMEDLASHIATHGSKYNRGDIYAVLAQAVDCTREKMLEGCAVELGDLGVFRLHAQTVGAATAAQCSAANIKALNVRFYPGKHLKNLREDATFELVPSRAKQAEAVTAEKARETQQAPADGGDSGLE